MAAVGTTIESSSDLVKHWGQLSDAALVGAVSLGLAIIIAVVIYIVFSYKKYKMIQSAKDMRSQEYIQSNEKVGNKLDRLSSTMSRINLENTKSLNESLSNINNTLGEVKSIIDVSNSQTNDFKSILVSTIDKIDIMSLIINTLLDKTKGVISDKDSLYLVKIYFYKIICNEIEKVIHHSLEENDFINRKLFVTDKVRTNIGMILSTYRSDLIEFELPFSVNGFFKIDSSSTSERFMLVDLIWMAVEDIFTSNMMIKEKKEEASLRIINVIRDYITEIFIQEYDVDENPGNYGKVISNH